MVNTKVYPIIAILVFYIFIALMLSEVGISYSGIDNIDVDEGTLPDVDDDTPLPILNFWGILGGIFTFELSTEYYVPIWINIVLWLPLLAMIILGFELIRGV